MTCQEMGNRCGVFDGGGKTDAAQVGRDGLQAAEGQHQLVATFTLREGVDFVDDDPLQSREHAGRILVTGQQRQTFRGG